MVDSADRAESAVVLGAHDDQFVGSKCTGDLVGVIEETTDTSHECADGGGVGTADEPDRPVDHLAERERGEDRGQRQRTSIDDDQGALAAREALIAAGGDVPAQSSGTNHCSTSAGSRPQSSTTPACSSVSRVTDALMSAAARDDRRTGGSVMRCPADREVRTTRSEGRGHQATCTRAG